MCQMSLRLPIIPFSVAFPPPYFFSSLQCGVSTGSIMFCLILTTVVCMSTQGGSYNFLRIEDFGLCDSFFLEVWWLFSAGQPLLNGHSHCQLAS